MTKFTILGCGSSMGSPWITNYRGKLKDNVKNIPRDDKIMARGLLGFI